jgi:hypothetical protein
MRKGASESSSVKILSPDDKIVTVTVPDDPVEHACGILKSELTAKEILQEGRVRDQPKESDDD